MPCVMVGLVHWHCTRRRSQIILRRSEISGNGRVRSVDECKPLYPSQDLKYQS